MFLGRTWLVNDGSAGIAESSLVKEDSDCESTGTEVGWSSSIRSSTSIDVTGSSCLGSVT